jgi:SARP family transcriptional regulator, regulator of embCAB operon
MEVKVLGPLSIAHEGREIGITAAKPRQVLAVLCLNETAVVPTAKLISELWEGPPPKSARTTLQTYVMKLRRMFGIGLSISHRRASHALLRTRGEGYQLSLGSAGLDLREYRHLEESGYQYLRSGNPRATIFSFHKALRLWQGAALADVNKGIFLTTEIAILEQSRLRMLKSLFEAELLLGRHRDVVSDLASLVLQHPFNEGLHALFMLALHRSGHRPRALQVFATLRSVLAKELGVPPSAGLQRLHQAILESDNSLISTTPAPGTRFLVD